MSDVGLTHIALPVEKLERSLSFYSKYGRMQVVHRRKDSSTGAEVAWISDRTRPFVVVLIEVDKVDSVLLPLAHLGIGCESREEVNLLCDQARSDGILIEGPVDAGYPVGYFALLRDPDGHTLELAHGQEVGLAVGFAQQ
ncbi:MAG TPA: VOC family protein [Blastocatellia bacterium]|nr:VOC family protein [Blastocatellia bacterium]